MTQTIPYLATLLWCEHEQTLKIQQLVNSSYEKLVTTLIPFKTYQQQERNSFCFVDSFKLPSHKNHYSFPNPASIPMVLN